MLDGPVTSAVMSVGFDDDGQVYLNGALVYDDHNGTANHTFGINVAPYVQSGLNLITAKGIDTGGLEAFAFKLDISTVPEPTTISLLLVGGLILLRKGDHSRPAA